MNNLNNTVEADLHFLRTFRDLLLDLSLLFR